MSLKIIEYAAYYRLYLAREASRKLIVPCGRLTKCILEAWDSKTVNVYLKTGKVWQFEKEI